MRCLKALAILLFFCSNLPFALAQENYNNKLSVSGMVYYSRFRWNEGHFDNLNITGPQIAYSFKNKRNNWHEFELAKIDLGYTNYQHAANLGLRYQYNIFILKSKINGKLKPFAGLGAFNFTKYQRSYPSANNSNSFGTKYFSSNLDVYISPGLEFNFKPRVYVTLQTPLTFINLSESRNRFYNPAWSAREQRNSAFEFNLIPVESFNARLSFGYRF